MNGNGLLGPVNGSPLLDGLTPIMDAVGADPSASPGLNWPPGSIAYYNGDWYWKFDKGLTSWAKNPFTTGSSGGATAASWGLTVDRYFILDYDNGNDANIGYIDAAPGSTFTAPQTAAVAIKTVEQLYSIVPQVGNGRSFVVLQRNRAAGASYLDKDAATVSSVDTSRWTGYRTWLWRGSSDLSNDANDRVTCGFIVAVAGPGAGSSFAAAAGATTTTVPIAAGAIAAEAATQFRIRFLPTTTTVALRNICRVITSGVVNTSVTVGNALPAVPAAGDVFVIERPGVRMDQCNFVGADFGWLTPSRPFGPELVALAFTTTVTNGIQFNGHRPTVCGVESTGATNNNTMSVDRPPQFTCDVSYVDEAGTTRVVGMGYRTVSSSTIAPTAAMTLVAFGSMSLTATTGLTLPLGANNAGSRSYFGGTTNVQGIAETISPATVNSTSKFGDSTVANAQTRVVANPASATPFAIFNSPVSPYRVNFEGFAAATHGPLYVKELAGQISIEGCTSDGTGPDGIDLSSCADLTVSLGRQIVNTITGTAGQVKLAGGAYALHTDFTKTNVIDRAGNNVQGTAGSIVGQCTLTTCRAADGLSVGSLCHFVATGVNASARNDDFTAAKCNAVAVVTAGQGALMYVVTPAAGAAPYVLSETVVIGGMAYVGLYAGGNAKANSNPANAGQFETAVGTWIDGADNSSGHLAWNPDQWPSFVDVLAVVGSANGDGLPFLIPDNMAAVQYVSLETGKAAGDEVSLGFTNSRIDIFLKATANPNEFVTRWFDAGSGHNTTVRVKWAFR